MTTALIHGLLLSFSLIIPLGAQNVFIFTQGATQPRFIKVMPLVVIAALCDTALILLAVLGVSVAVLSISWIKTLLICSGVLFLGWIGWSNWQASLEDLPSDCENNTKSPLLFALSVSLLNPHAILIHRGHRYKLPLLPWFSQKRLHGRLYRRLMALVLPAGNRRQTSWFLVSLHQTAPHT